MANSGMQAKQGDSLLGGTIASEEIATSVTESKTVVFDVLFWPDVDEAYTTVLLRLPGGYEARLSGPNAQRLGARLNRAGGGDA